MARTRKNRIQLGFDALEDRSVPASGLSASLANGQLSILGTEGDDMIVVRHVPAQSRVPAQIRIDGLSQTFDAARISKIVVQGGAGNDTIDLYATRAMLGKPGYSLELWGGAGNDNLSGSLNNDKLFGGSGNDFLFGGNGNDLLDGGEGDDVLYGDAGADTIFGDSGNDQMFGGAGGDNLIGGSGDDYYEGNYGLDYYIEASPGNETYNDNTPRPIPSVYQKAGSSHPLAWFEQLSDSGVRSSVRAMALDGQFTRQDTLELFHQIKADGVVSSEELHDLQSLTTTNSLRMPEHVYQLLRNVVQPQEANMHFQGEQLEVLQAGSSAEHLDNLVKKWFLGQDRPETLNPSHIYQYAKGTLFTSTRGVVSITPMELRQGFDNIKNSGLYSAMMTVAQTNPNLIRNMFIDNGDGTFTIKLFDGTQARYVTVDRYLPADAQGKLVYGQVGASVSSTTNVLWPALLEKAIAQSAETGWLPVRTNNNLNSYRSINATDGNSLWSGQALGLLTGREFSIGNQITAEALPELIELIQAKEFVTIASNVPPNCGTVTSPLVAISRGYTVLSYNPAKGGSFKLIASTGTGYSLDLAGRRVPGIITLTTAEFLANMQYYDTTMSQNW